MATVSTRLEFVPEDLFINEKSQRLPYQRRTGQSKTSIHWGQRKLMLSEIEFFTIFWDPQQVPNPLCVYAGAASGVHIPLLSEMFPAITFHLYDPSNFAIKENDKIKIFTGKEHGYFTNEVAKTYAGRKDVFFISDIRTAGHKDTKKKFYEAEGITVDPETYEPLDGDLEAQKRAEKKAEQALEEEIWQNMNWQQEWVEIMDPVHALLKFRLPYVIEGNEKVVSYLQGMVFWQVYPGQTSSETRLKPVRGTSGKYERADWNTKEYEDWCFHHNVMAREHFTYINPLTKGDEPIDPPELLNDFDSTCEAFILKMYCEKMGTRTNSVKQLSRLITLAINYYMEPLKTTLNSLRTSEIKSTNRTAGAISAQRAPTATVTRRRPGVINKLPTINPSPAPSPAPAPRTLIPTTSPAPSPRTLIPTMQSPPLSALGSRVPILLPALEPETPALGSKIPIPLPALEPETPASESKIPPPLPALLGGGKFGPPVTGIFRPPGGAPSPRTSAAAIKPLSGNLPPLPSLAEEPEVTPSVNPLVPKTLPPLFLKRQ